MFPNFGWGFGDRIGKVWKIAPLFLFWSVWRKEKGDVLKMLKEPMYQMKSIFQVLYSLDIKKSP